MRDDINEIIENEYTGNDIRKTMETILKTLRENIFKTIVIVLLIINIVYQAQILDEIDGSIPVYVQGGSISVNSSYGETLNVEVKNSKHSLENFYCEESV